MSEPVSERILKAIHVELGAGAPAGVRILRNVGIPERIDPGGLAILRDGDPGEPSVSLSPLTFHYRHRAALDLVVAGDDPGTRDRAFARLKGWISAALAVDPTLGGLCDWAEPLAAAAEIVAVEGVTPFKAATVEIEIHYASPDRLV